MKRVILIAVGATAFLAILSIGIRHYVWTPSGPGPVASGPATEPAGLALKYPLAAPPLRLRVETWDLGTCLPGKENSHSFEITNTAAENWTLKHITSTCSCATAQLSSKTIRPGETAKLEVTYRAPRQDGNVSGYVVVDFAERNSAVFQLIIEGQVRSLLASDPPGVVFDQPPAGTRARRTVTLRNYSDQRIQISRVEAPDWLQTELRSLDVERAAVSEPGAAQTPRQAWELVIHADPAKLAGAAGSATIVVHSDSEQAGSAFIGVSIKAPLEATPDYLTFDTAASRKAGMKVAVRVAPSLGELTEKDMIVTHNLGDELEVQVHKESPHLFVLLVRLQPKRTSVVAEGELEIRTRNETVPPIRVRISATGGAP